MKVHVEIEADDAWSIGMTLQSLAHSRLADAPAAARLERVGSLMCAAKPLPADDRDAILSMLGELVFTDRAYWQDDRATAAVCRMSDLAVSEVLAFADQLTREGSHKCSKL